MEAVTECYGNAVGTWMFTTRIGERNGVYTVIGAVNASGHKFDVTMRCDVCGREVTRGSDTFARHDLSACMCDRFEKWATKQSNRKQAPAGRGVVYSRHKQNFNSSVKRTITKYPETRHDDFDTIWNALGEPPEDTETYKWYLRRKYRGARCRDYTVENMEWAKVVRTGTVRALCTMHPNRTLRSCRNAARRNIDVETMDGLDVGATRFWMDTARSLKEDYALFVGRKFHSWRVVGVSRDVHAGWTCYNFALRCERCGKIKVAQASKVLKKCVRCACHAYAGKGAKNSSTHGDSVLTRKKMAGNVPRRNGAAYGYDPDSILILQGHVSEYTLYAGMEGTIYALIDNEITMSAEHERRREYIEWLGG
jgi:hypothetical protein